MPFSYDQLPYRAAAYRLSHPNRMSTIGRIFGMRPAALPTCRYLEIGCATGGNMLPVACVLPDAKFVGIDLGHDHIETARADAAALGLENVTFHQMDVRDATRDLGEFDYIIAHGIYSWVPPEARDAILRVCRENLSPQGIAYISYNVYPGWFMLGMVREMMLRHTRAFDTIEQKVSQARALMDFLAKTTRAGSVYGSFLRRLASDYKNYPDTYVYHEHLVADNQPFWFDEFVTDVEAAELQYLGDGELGSMMTSSFPPEVARELDALEANLIVTEQYMDLINRRTFRTSLVCHADVKLQRSVDLDVLDDLMITTELGPEETSVDLALGVEAAFAKNKEGEKRTTTTHPLVKAALVELADRRPQAVRVEELLEAARRRLRDAGIDEGPESEERVRADLLTAFAHQAVDLLAFTGHCAEEIAEFPKTLPTARLAAERGEPQVADLRHFGVRLEPLDVSIVRRLDGKHDRAALVAGLREDLEAGRLTLDEKHADLKLNEEKLRWVLEGVVDDRLSSLHRYWLLVK